MFFPFLLSPMNMWSFILLPSPSWLCYSLNSLFLTLNPWNLIVIFFFTSSNVSSWYEEDSSRSDAQEKLLQQPTGAFIIRGSQNSAQGRFAISVRYFQCVYMCSKSQTLVTVFQLTQWLLTANNHRHNLYCYAFGILQANVILCYF